MKVFLRLVGLSFLSQKLGIDAFLPINSFISIKDASRSCIYSGKMKVTMGIARIFRGGGTLFENFQKILLRKLRKMHYLRIWNFENFWWKFYRTWNFIFLKNLLLKIEPSEITAFFNYNFFCFGGFPPFPLATPLKVAHPVPHHGTPICKILDKIVKYALSNINFLSVSNFIQVILVLFKYCFRFMKISG